MYDNFEPFNQIEPIEFQFYPRNFEIYANGQLQQKGSTELVVGTKKITDDNYATIMMVIGDFTNSLNNQIKTNLNFDKVVTSSDRILLVKLPQSDNHSQLNMITSSFGATRENYSFEQNEPYTCSLFTQNGNVKKLSFNLYNNTMIELF